MDIDHAKDLIRSGKRFGDVFLQLTTDDDRDELRHFFCYEANTIHRPLTGIPGTTGEICDKCYGCNVKKAGTCSICMDCGDTLGGCS